MDTTKTTFEGIAYAADPWVLLGIILLAGILGGLANFYKDDTNVDFSRFKFTKSILLGLVAAAIIPLFLQMISSNLLTTEMIPLFNFFVFGGFCLVAAVYSGKFLETVSDSVINQLKKVSEKVDNVEETAENANQTAQVANQNADAAHDKAEAVITQSEEPSASPDAHLKTEGVILESLQKKSTNPVIQAMDGSQYNFRTLEGIAKDLEKDQGEVLTELQDLQAKGQVKEIVKKDGTVLYSMVGKKSS